VRRTRRVNSLSMHAARPATESDPDRVNNLPADTYCSPTRRSFVTGRFPVHISGFQADICSNWTPLNMTLLSQKLALAGFQSHFVGKTNLGFETTDHMPIRRGFTSHVGFLYGMEDYHWGQIGCAYRNTGCKPGPENITVTRGEAMPTKERALGSPGRPPSECEVVLSAGQPVPRHCIPNRGIGMDAHTTAMYFTHDFWFNDAPAPALAREVYYSTNWYTEYTLSLLRNHSAANAEKLWIHLCYQAVHGPFEEVPPWEQLNPAYLRGGDRVYGDMLAVMDSGLANITKELKGPGNKWDETLIIVTSDNGGPTTRTGPNNYPLRGGMIPTNTSPELSILCELLFVCIQELQTVLHCNAFSALD
jgi:hypothetical protein